MIEFSKETVISGRKLSIHSKRKPILSIGKSPIVGIW